MKRLAAALILAALPLSAQEKPASEPEKVVATVNGEVITATKLDRMYDNLGAQTRAQYDKTGGKLAFLENYLRKRLMIQEALKSGFDKRPDVQADMEAASENTLFDRYVRDVVSASIVSEADMRKYYDANPDSFVTPESVRARHIVVTFNNKSKESAMEKIQRVATELFPYRPKDVDDPNQRRMFLSRFAQAAEMFSDDSGTRAGGGDLGWATPGTFDPKFEEAAFSLRPGLMSGIIESQFGYHLIVVEEKRPPGKETFEQARPALREFLIAQKVAEVMETVAELTNELRATSKVSLFPENVN